MILKYLLNRFGICAMSLGFTLLAVLLSLAIAGTVHWAAGAPMSQMGLFITVLCPLLITPPLSLTVLRLLSELDAAQERLRALSDSDPLTQVHNRRYFMERLRAELDRSRRYATPYALAFIDIDNFKAINDRYGHLSGDEVLTQIAQACRGNMRQIDTFARIGGEEFAVLLPQTTAGHALALLERLRQQVQSLRIEVPDAVLEVTVSIGLVSPNGVDAVLNGGINGVLRMADEALYVAKRGGKNRVVVAAAAG